MRSPLATCFLAVGVAWVREGAGAGTAPPTGGTSAFPIRVATAHFEVLGQERADRVTAAAQAAEEVYADFYTAFGESLRLVRPTRLLPVLCLTRPIQTQDARGRPVALAGLYSSWSGVARVAVDLGVDPLNENRARVRHEVTHQLTDAALAIPGVRGDRSFWYKEGLACYFEARGRYGLDDLARVTRLGVLRALYAREPLPDLATIVGLKPGANDAEPYSARAYALAWSVCHFLIHGQNGELRDRFMAYLDSLRDWSRHGRSAELFARIVGDPAALQEPWARHIQLLLYGSQDQLAARLATWGSAPQTPRGGAERRLEPVLAGEPTAPAPPPGRPSTAKLAELRQRIHAVPVFPPAEWDAVREALAGDPLAVPGLAAIAGDSRDPCRVQAIRALGRLKARSALGALVDLTLKDPSRDARLAAAEAIARVNYGVAPHAIYQWLQSGAVSRVVPAAEALGEVGDPFAVEPLLAALARSGAAPRRFSASVSRAAPAGRGAYRGSGGGMGVVSFGAGGGASERGTSVTAALMAALRNVSGANPGDTAEDWLIWGRDRDTLPGAATE